MTRGTIRITSAVMSSLSRVLDLCESLRERARSPLVTEDAYTVDRALEHGVRKRRHLRALDDKDRVILVGELVHDLALAELALDGLLVVGFDDDPWSGLHDRTLFLQLHPTRCQRGLKST